MSRNEAEKRFWKTPELVERLLPFLDPPSILTLAQAHPLTTGVIQGTYNWGRFIRRSCPYATPNLQLSLEEKIEQKVGELKPIIGVLELIGNPQAHLLQLLDAICERFPSEDARRQCVKMTCPIHEVHSVSALGFMLLELVEATNSPFQQKVGSLLLGPIKGALIPALKSRVMRQEELKIMVSASSFHCRTQEDAEALLTLVRLTEGFSFQRLGILDKIGEGGWTTLAKALRLLSAGDMAGFVSLHVGAKHMILDGMREDVRTVWDALPQGTFLLMNWSSTVTDLRPEIFRKESEEDWMRLELYLDNRGPVEAENADPDN